MALPHVSRRHQPLAGGEVLAVHVGGGNGCGRTTDPRRTHDGTRMQLASWTVRQGLGTKMFVSLSHMREPLQTVRQKLEDVSMRRAVRAFRALRTLLEISPASLHLIGLINH